jgi:phosphoribosylglycinamide formyltransferase-1
MRLLSPAFLARFSRPTLNIHPSLLPAYPGLHAVERQWADGVHESGATVHLVDEGLDTGPVILQGRIRVRGEEGVAGLRSRIQQEVEHIIYPAALCMLLAGLPQST